MVVTIYHAGLGELGELTTLENELFVSDRISRRQFLYLIKKVVPAVYVLREGRELVAYSVLLMRKNSKKMRIYSIGVSSSSRGKGYGWLLLDHARNEATQQSCKGLTLEVCETNLGALRLYTKWGFIISGRKENYCEDGSTAILMRQLLAEG